MLYMEFTNEQKINFYYGKYKEKSEKAIQQLQNYVNTKEPIYLLRARKFLQKELTFRAQYQKVNGTERNQGHEKRFQNLRKQISTLTFMYDQIRQKNPLQHEYIYINFRSDVIFPPGECF